MNFFVGGFGEPVRMADDEAGIPDATDMIENHILKIDENSYQPNA